MQALVITTLSQMKDHHTLQISHANLVGIDTIDYHPTGDKFQWKTDKIFKDLLNVFGTAGDILVVGYDSDGKDHDEMLWKVLQICKQVNLKLNEDKCHFIYTSVPFFGEVISRHGVRPKPHKLKALLEMLSPKTKRNSKHFLE